MTWKQNQLTQSVVQRVQVVQHRPSSYPCSVSGHVSGRQTTPLHDAGPFALAPMPPVRSLVQERSSGETTESLQQTAQQLPAASAVFNLKGANGGDEHREDRNTRHGEGSVECTTDLTGC